MWLIRKHSLFISHIWCLLREPHFRKLPGPQSLAWGGAISSQCPPCRSGQEMSAPHTALLPLYPESHGRGLQQGTIALSNKSCPTSRLLRTRAPFIMTCGGDSKKHVDKHHSRRRRKKPAAGNRMTKWLLWQLSGYCSRRRTPCCPTLTSCCRSYRKPWSRVFYTCQNP